MREYDQIAEWYGRVRDPQSGAADVVAFARSLPPEARVLDLGCGNGEPVSRLLMEAGHRVRALDSSAEMVARYRARFPGVDVRHVPAQEADYPEGAFDAVVAWGVLFHLPAEAQRALLARVARWLASGGALLFTSGGEAGEHEDTMDGVVFPYVSLGVAGYRAALDAAGLRLEREHVNTSGNHVYLARRQRPLAGTGGSPEAGVR